MISGFSAFLPVFSQIFIHTWFRAHIYYQRRDASYLKTMKTRQQRQAISDLQTKKKKSTRSRVSATTEDDDDLETSPRKKVLRSGRAKRKLTKKKSNRRVSGSSLSSTSSPFKKQKTSPKKNILKIPSDVCNFCKMLDGKVYELGELRKCEDITVHMYCLFFSPGLTQNGQPNEGIDGFLLPDIRKELRRASQLRCSYCDQRSAAIGCGIASCSANFHLPCGLKNGVFTQFHDPNHSFPAYCKRHRPKLNLPSFKGTLMCTICQENVKFNADRPNLVFLSCCSTYFHRSCLNQLAYYQGEFSLKCPNCLNSEEFIPSLKKSGIYVPCRDFLVDNEPITTTSENVIWECCADTCNCENGRAHNGDNEWELFACDRCGSNAVHIACAGLGEGSEWSCEICRNVV